MNRDGWYEFSPALFEMVKCLSYRDTSYLPLIRALNVFKVDGLKKTFDLVRMKVNKPNIYRSVASLKGIPRFTYNPKMRKSETLPWYQEEYDKHVKGYDLFFDADVDGPKDPKLKDNWVKLLEEIREFTEYLNEYKLPFYTLFSGSKGFQTVIPYEYLPQDLSFKSGDENNIYDWTKKVTLNMKEMFDLKYLDLRNVGVNSRLMKCPYSLAGDNVVLPLTDYQLKNFKVEDMRVDKVHKNTKIFNRGLQERQSNLSTEQKKQNVEDFIKEFNLNK